MKQYVFWTNILSPHQSFIINKWAENHKVFVVFIEKLSVEREKLGWQLPKYSNVCLVHYRNDSILKSFISKDYINIFSGILAYPEFKNYFKQSLRLSTTLVISEMPICLTSIELVLKRLKYTYLVAIYGRKLQGVLAISSMAERFYKQCLMSSNKIFPYQYTLDLYEERTLKIIQKKPSSKCNFVFIGQLIERKGLRMLLQAVKLLNERIAGSWSLSIIGDGGLRVELEEFVNRNNLEKEVLFLGVRDQQEVCDFLEGYADCLILPSRFDGWGAVVNESLSFGVPVIVSANCGASDIVRSENEGYIFDTFCADDLSLKMLAIEGLLDTYRLNRSVLAREYFRRNQTDILENFSNIMNSVVD